MANRERNRNHVYSMIARRTTATVIVVLVFMLVASFGRSAQAQTAGNFDMTVDALRHCITLDESEDRTFATAKHPIPTGYYEVSVDSNAYYYWGIPVKKVAIYVTTDDQPYGWFYTVSEGTPLYLHVSGLGGNANLVRGFFVDTGCGDNSGSATIHFRQIH